jgi:hypothetical protein
LNKGVLITRTTAVAQQLKLSAQVILHPLTNLGTKRCLGRLIRAGSNFRRN